MMGDREANLELLGLIAAEPFERCEAEWKKLLYVLRLELSYVLPMQKVLQQEGWRRHPNPLAYVRKAAVRTAVRMGLVDAKPQERLEVLAADLNYTDWDGEELEHDEKLDLALYEYEQKHPEEWRSLPSDQVRSELWDDKTAEVAWERVGDLAELDEGERLVLELRAIGFTRELALKACYSQADRRLVQAAWRRLEREKESIKKVLRSGKAPEKKPVKKAVADFELVLLQGADGQLKISFRMNVPENGKTRI